MSPPEPSPESKPLRLFAAVDLSPEVLGRVSQALEPLRETARHAKWVSPESMHLTLFFFGWVDRARLPPLEAALARAVEGHPPLTLAIREAGTFGPRSHPRVLWLGVDGEVQALGELQQAVTREVVPLGFEAETRDFTPHLTLARAREQRGDRELAACRATLAGFDAGSSPIDALTLYRSELSPRGARYTVMQRFGLRHGR